MKTPHILMVEDNPGDADLIRDTLEAGRVKPELSQVSDGVEAIEFLNRHMKLGGAVPDIILLDLNLPRKHGIDVLSEIRQSVALKHIPVIVLSSSDAEADIMRSYREGANCYVLKPDNLKGYRETIAAIEDFWMAVSQLPAPAEMEKPA